ncbi:MAG TPA: glutamate racemase [Kofleriaceae bacterium]|nr:glutamate racemase [Kofleriaceae bacterium]
MNDARRSRPEPVEGPIGVFDSGAGGLTVVHALRARLPGEDVVYLGDTARVPYGSKSARTVERYSLTCQQFLLDRGVKLVLIACNTASAHALPALRTASPVPVIGAVEPGADAAVAATRNRHVGVIGTLGTIRSGAYERALAARAADIVITTHPCPLFVPLAEEGWTDDEVARAVARRYLRDLFARDPDIDTLVLGCTHYPLLRGVIRATAHELAGHDVVIVDSATAMAEAAAGALQARDEPRPNGPGRLGCFATDISRLDELAPRFLGEPMTAFELVDL